jgi:AraC-like DNA-binding protein
MRRVVISTEEVREGERFSYWCAAISRGADRSHRRAQQGTGRCIHPAFRRQREIARGSWHDHFLFYREFSAGAWFGWDRGELFTQPGELVFADPTVPFATKARTNYDYDVWVLPRKLLDPHLPASQRPRSLVLASQSGLAGIIKAYLDVFGRQIDALDDPEVDVVADNFCRLLAVGCGGRAGEHQEAIRLARLEEAKRYVNLHLSDPELTPENAAAALKMSLRQLHLLFEPAGTSFAQYVLRRRLEECRAALAGPSGSITDIALGWGFNSLATFHRNFRQAFGATPSEFRGSTTSSR